MQKLEDSLNGGYGGLYGEVVTCDIYRLRQVRFQPDLVFDIGANVGVFSRFARTLFPKAKIVAVEPHPANCEVFRQYTPDPNTFLLECAMGRGNIYHTLTAVNGSGENYLSPGLGYPEGLLAGAVVQGKAMELSAVPSLTLQEIYRDHYQQGMKVLMKIDCEGAENILWEDPEAMGILRSVDYLCMELHDYAQTGEFLQEVKTVTAMALVSLAATHNCERQGVNFWATKRTYE